MTSSARGREAGGLLLGMAAVLAWASSASGVLWIGRQLGAWQYLAIGNGILTVENDAQAWVRARRAEGDKGGFAARAALTMIAHRMRFGA